MIYCGKEMPNLKRLQFFEKNAIDWKGEYALHDFYKTLLELRKRNPALRTNDPAVVTHFIITSADKSIMAYLRKNENDEILVLLNLCKEKTDFVIKDQLIDGSFMNVFSNTENYLTVGTSVEMQPWEFLVYEKM